MGHEDGEFKKTGLGYNGEVKIGLKYKEQMFKKEEEEEGDGSIKFFVYPAEPQHLGGQNTCSLQSPKKSIQELFLKD